MACLATLFVLQRQVLASPQARTAAFIHSVSYKGGTFYLAEPLFTVWTSLEAAVMPLCGAALLLIVGCNTLEYRVKRQLWDKHPL